MCLLGLSLIAQEEDLESFAGLITQPAARRQERDYDGESHGGRVQDSRGTGDGGGLVENGQGPLVCGYGDAVWLPSPRD
jgi:hypothetical protein